MRNQGGQSEKNLRFVGNGVELHLLGTTAVDAPLQIDDARRLPIDPGVMRACST